MFMTAAFQLPIVLAVEALRWIDRVFSDEEPVHPP